jgi:hypothetical protein
MPKPRHSISSSSATTTTITISPTPSNSSSITSQPQYLHNTSYGLLEPAKLSVKPPQRQSLHHRRKSSSSSSSPVWSEKGFDFSELKGRSVDLGEKISEKVPGVRYSAGKSFFSPKKFNA